MAATIPVMVRFFFSADGWASRADAWRWLAPLHLVLCVAAAIDFTFRLTPAPVATLAVGAFLLWPSFAVAAKRFHDRGLSCWWMLWLLLAAATGACAMTMDPGSWVASGGRFVMAGAIVLALAVVYVLPGQDEPNGFGAPTDPKIPEELQHLSGWEEKLKMTPVSVKRCAQRPCKPVPQSFKAMKTQVASLFEPPLTPPGARATFGRRGE